MPGTKKPPIWIIILLVLSGTIAPAASARERLSGTLMITGSSTMAPLIAKMGRAFERSHKGARIEVHGFNSDRGLSDTRRGKSSIGMVSRLLKEDERDLKAFPVALDAICFIVSSRNSVTTIPKSQLVRIFSGKAASWKELGGKNEQIKVVLREDSHSSTKIVSEFLHIPVYQLKGTIIPAESQVTIKAVANNSSTIGYVSFGEAYRYSSQQGKIRMLGIDGQFPGKAAIVNGTYPLIRVLNLVVKGEPSPLAKEFIKYCRSKAVADMVQAFDFVNLEL